MVILSTHFADFFKRLPVGFQNPSIFLLSFFFFKFLGNHCSNLDFCGMPRPCGQPQCTLYVILFSSTVLLQIAVCI